MIQLIFALVFIGVLMWAFNTYVPMQPPFKGLINALVILLVVYWLFTIFFGNPGIVTTHFPRWGCS